MFLRDKLKKVFCWLVVYFICFRDKAVLCFQFGFVSIVPPIIEYVCREVSVQLRTVPNTTAFVVDERDTINPSAVVPADNRIDTLLYKLLFKIRFAVCGVHSQFNGVL